ncbi:MAG TPA: hypothetical protein VF120_08710 [Ktedonobacterales bacterium]
MHTLRHFPQLPRALALLILPILLPILLLAGCGLSTTGGTSGGTTGGTTGGAPIATASATIAPTNTPIPSCATLDPGASAATSVTGFTDVHFPTGAVRTSVASSFGGASQFTILLTNVCYTGTADDLTGPFSGHHSVTANLLGAGWGTATLFPYPGDLLQSCPSECFQTQNTRYVAFEKITDHGGGLFTYSMRLAAPPPAPTCNSNFSSSPIPGVQTSVDNVPLPPITFVAPDDATNLHGEDLCSSGTIASISAFLTKAMPAAGWTKVASDPRCFYTDECWTTASTAMSWHVDDPTDWHLAYHPHT